MQTLLKKKFTVKKRRKKKMLLLSDLITVIIVFTITIVLLFYCRWNRNLPPGPWGLPVVGYYPFIPTEHYRHFANLAKRYGNVFSFRTVGGNLIVVINGIDAIKDVLINRAEDFIGRPAEENLLTWISNGLGIAQEDGSMWKEHRRFFLQTAKTFGFGKQESEQLIHEEITTLLHDLKEEKGRPADVRFHVAYATNSVICPILFSKKFEKDHFRDIAKAATYLVEMFVDQQYMLVGFLYEHIVMKLFPRTKRIREAKKLFMKLTKEIVDDHVKTFDPENTRDYIDGYLQQAHKLDKTGVEHSFTMDRLKSITLNMIMEGTESVGGTIYGHLDLASKHPEEQKLVQEELDSVVGRERLPTWMDRQKLPYLEALIQELYRCNMPFNISTQYSNYKETMIQGYRIPQRTIIVANQWTVNNDPVLYPEPSKFNPKRFIDEEGKKIKTEGPYPFGIGKRACIGESLAQMEVFLIIASLLQNFTFYPPDQPDFLRAVPRS